MKLASLQGGRNGRLVVVSNDLAWYAPADAIAPTLQAALDDWERCEPQLRALAESLEHGALPQERFHEHDAASPLPRAYLWLLGSSATLQPVVADKFLAPRQEIPRIEGAEQLHLSAGVAVITGEVPQAATAEEALSAVRLVMLCSEVATSPATRSDTAAPSSLSKAASTFSPVAVTPDSLQTWRDGRLEGALEVELNGKPRNEIDPAVAVVADLGRLIAQAARERPLSAGTIVGLCPEGETGAAQLKRGDTVRIDMRDSRRHSIFGAIEQEVAGP